MQKKPTKDKAAPKPTKDKATKPTADKTTTLTANVEPAYTTEPQRDTFGVSFCIIAREQDFGHLQQCMASLPESAQVCILLNAPGNADEDTITPVDVAYHEGRTVRSRKWTYPKDKFSFATARNYAGQMATCDWIFWIDCDELLAYAQHDGIRYAAFGHGPGVGGFYAAQSSMTRYDQMTGGQCEYIAIKQLRMYRNHPALKWEGHAHEQIAQSVHDAGYSIVDTSIVVIHNGYSLDDGTLKRKLERNAALIGRWLGEFPTHTLRRYYEDVYCREIVSLRKLEKANGKL